jgi:Zn-dependent peptidase ImmA (M78 family)
MKYAEEWEAINQARRAAPVNVVGLATALGIRVYETFLDPQVSGVLKAENGGYSIAVNAGHPTTRQRFTVAHELGHYMLHRNLIGEGISDSVAYRSANSGQYFNQRIGPSEETEANRFAANLLMPRELLTPSATDGVNTGDLARLFGVSEQAMAIRLNRPHP